MHEIVINNIGCVCNCGFIFTTVERDRAQREARKHALRNTPAIIINKPRTKEVRPGNPFGTKSDVGKPKADHLTSYGRMFRNEWSNE